MTGKKNKVSFIGLGKLGLGLALSISDSGIQVLGVDGNKSLTKQLKKGKLPIYEPSLEPLLKKNLNSNFHITDDKSSAILQTNITYILIQTPSKKDGRFNSLFLEKLINEICTLLNKICKKHHTIVICSTLQPGTITSRIIPLINSYKKLKVGDNVGLVYNPESVALGEIVRGFQYPDYMIIGSSDKYSGSLIGNLSKKYTKNKPEIIQMSLTSGEITKITLNAFLCMKISFANYISQVSRNMKDADHVSILKAIGHDKRIGSKFLKAGPSFGGTCFPRDVIAFSKFNKDINLDSNLIDSVKQVNDKQHKLIQKDLKKIIKKNKIKKVCIFGYAFKENTPITYLSPSINVLQFLEKLNMKVSVYDSYVNKIKEVDTEIKIYRNIKKALLDNSLIILMHTNNDEVCSVLPKIDKKKCIYDAWSSIKDKNIPHHIYSLGSKI